MHAFPVWDKLLEDAQGAYTMTVRGGIVVRRECEVSDKSSGPQPEPDNSRAWVYRPKLRRSVKV